MWKCAKKFKVESKNIWLVHDELDAKFGKIKLSHSISASGHNGIKSVIKSFSGENIFRRVRIGIGRPESKDPEIVADYVLSKFKKDEMKRLTEEIFPEVYKKINELM